jgi:preprotein translocase subunit Sec63
MLKKREAEKVLGLISGYSQHKLKQTRRKLLMQYHPDHNASPDAKRITQEINLAYEILAVQHSYREHEAREHHYPYNQPKLLRAIIFVVAVVWALADVIHSQTFAKLTSRKA